MFNKKVMKFKKIEKEYSELNERIINNAPLSIVTINTDGRITFVNKYFENFASAKQGVGKNIFHMPFFVREKLVEEYKKLFETGRPFTKSKCFTKNLAGESKYLNISAVPLKDKNGKIEGALSMATDVTETIMAKNELSRLNGELEKEVARKTEQLVDINKKLEKSLELKSQFISDASHELRTPLAIAKLNLELFKNQLSQKGIKSLKDIDAIDNEMNKIRDILTDLSFITSIDEKEHGKIKKHKVDLAKLIENVIKRLKTIVDKKNIEIIWQKSMETPVIKGDEMRLEMVFTNIIRNAVKYGEKNGWVKVWLEPDPSRQMVKINIADNGMGIPKKDLPYIFDRFYRTDLSIKKGEGGFGLGLAICKWIAEQHNGFIDVKSTVGKGSLFAINLPMEHSSS